MANSHGASRTPSIPINIPVTAGRSIEDILNYNGLSPIGASTFHHRERSTQARQIPSARSVQSRLHGSSTISSSFGWDTSASTSLGPSSGGARHPLAGGSGAITGTRAVSNPGASSIVNPRGPSSMSVSSMTMPSPVVGFEPRVVRGTVEHIPSTDASHQSHQRPANQRRDSMTSPTRSLRMSTGGTLSTSRQTARRPSLGSVGSPHSPSSPFHGDWSTSSGAHGPVLHPVPPPPFLPPQYLQLSALHYLIHTEASAPTGTPSNVRVISERESSLPSSTRLGVLRGTGHHQRDVTPITESDEDSESGVGAVGNVSGRGRRRDIRSRAGNAYMSNDSVALSGDPLVLRLPSRWSDQDRNKFLTLTDDGRSLHFHGPNSSGDKDAAAVRADFPIPPACGVYYYEITVLDKGTKGHISIGLSTENVRLTRLPGWEKDSWGYHGDDGHSFASEKDGKRYAEKYTTKDIIGCGIDFTLYKAFFTKNGSFLGYVFDDVGRDVPIFPTVGLRTAGESIRVNFGQEPFKFDIEHHVRCVRERTWEKIQNTPIRWEIDDDKDVLVIESVNTCNPQISKDLASGSNVIKSEGLGSGSDEVKQEAQDEPFKPIELPPDYSPPLNRLVYSYLIHHGYERTARAFKSQFEARAAASPARVFGSSLRNTIGKTEDLDIDIKMEMDDYITVPEPDDYEGPFDLDGLVQEDIPDEFQSRQQVVNAVLSGNIGLALELITQRYPIVLDMSDDSAILIKLQCRQFVELLLQASEALKKTRIERQAAESRGVSPIPDSQYQDESVTVAMDVDDDESLPPATNGFSNGNADVQSINSHVSPTKASNSRPPPPSPAVAEYSALMQNALLYGRKLSSDYKDVERAEVQDLLKRTFALISYDDPREATGEAAELVSGGARSQLAQEVNQAILESQGRPSRPALERLYRQTSVIVAQLGLWGVGEAVFADTSREFLTD